jgi:hypothetical protein
MMQPVSDREQVTADAVAGLRLALLSSHGVGDAVRRHMTELLPQLELAEDGWFAAGLPDSPLAARAVPWLPRDDEEAR